MAFNLRPLLAASSLLTVLSCGGGGASPAAPTTPATPSSASPQVGGSYEIAVRLTDNSCGPGVTVAAQPTSVAHVPGAAEFTLTHGGFQAAGTVGRDGAFTTRPSSVQDPQGPATLAIAGRFTATTLEATVTVDVQRATQPCRYLVNWTGVKQGGPNVIG